MTPNLRKIRKAAVLVASLDRDAADVVMNQMTPLQARLVRRAMVELGSIDPAEQNDVIEDFFRTAPRVAKDDLEGIELGDQLLDGSNTPNTQRESERTPREENSRSGSLHFLKHTPIDPLAPLLERERPQTIAVVLSHLSPEGAATLLGRLPEALQVEVTHRMIELDNIDRAALAALEEGVAVWLAQHTEVRKYGVGARRDGRAAVDQILNAASAETRRNMMAAIPDASASDFEPEVFGPPAPPAHPVAPPQPIAPVRPIEPSDGLSFEEFCELDSISAAAIVGEAYPEIAALALVGADSAFTDRVLDQLLPAQAAAIRESMNDLGPTSLADVELAQKEIARLAEQRQSRSHTPNQTNGRLSVVG